MTTVLRPADAAQVLEVVRWAAAEERTLELRGQGSKRALGRPAGGDHVLDLSALSGIALYEAEELVLTAGPATPLRLVEELLTQHGQQLAFEPADLGPLLGAAPEAQSLGGVIAANLSGPRRIKAGAARDHFLGVRGVSGRGESFKSGGRVVKNVTGYDLCKLLAGSHGTLAVMTEVTVKVLPAPEKTRTVLVFGLDDARAVQALSQAGGSPHEVSGLAHLPAPVAARSSVPHVADAGAAVTAVRVEGPAPSVAHRCGALKRELGAFGAVEELHSRNSTQFWREVRDVRAFADAPDRIVWKLSVTPMRGPAVVSAVAEESEAEAFYDWAGGLIWLSLPPSADAAHGLVRRAVGGHGHATLVRAAEAVRAAVPVFQPQTEALARLSSRVKESFDPRRILNRGRMYEGV